MSTIYTDTTGTTCHLDGQRGRTTGFTYSPTGKQVTGAFVKMEDGSMRFAMLGGYPDGGRHEVTEHRAITRDDFDRLVQIPALRAELGWAA